MILDECFTDEQIKQMVKEHNLKTADDIQNLLKEMFGKTFETMLEAELQNQLGYSKYDYKNKRTDNSRNGHTPKTVLTNAGEVEIQIPRERNSEFKPVVVKKNQRDVSSIDNQVISMYAKGMSVREKPLE